MKTTLILLLIIGVAVVSSQSPENQDHHNAIYQNQISRSPNSENNVGSIFDWGSHTHNHATGYGYGRPSYKQGYGNHYASNYGTNYGNRGYFNSNTKRPLNNHIYVKGPVFGSGSLRSPAGAGTVGSVHEVAEETIDPVHHHHATMVGINHLYEPAFRTPENSLPDLSHRLNTQPPAIHPQHALMQPQNPQIPQPLKQFNFIPTSPPHLHLDMARQHHHHHHPGQARLANYRHSEHSYPQSNGGVQCGQNVLVGCQPTVQEVPCSSAPAKY